MIDESDRGVIEQQIEDWIKRFVAFPDVKANGPCSKVTLRHLGVDKKPQGDVRSWPVRLEEGADEDYLPLLHQIAEAAQEDADSLNQGVQSYAVYAHYQTKNFFPRKVFRVSPTDVEVSHDVNPSEPASAEGLVAQTMRHLEAVMRTSTVSMGYVMQNQQRELQRLAAMNEAFSKQQLDMMLLVQDTIDNGHGRRLAEKKTEADIATRDMVLTKLDALVPVIVNRIAGKQVMPEPDQSFMLMSSLLEGLTEKQQMDFFNSLTDVQRITLAEVLSQYEQKKEKYTRSQNERLAALLPKGSLPGSKPDTADPFKPKPLPEMMSLGERMEASANTPPTDPKIVELEQNAERFASRLKDFRDLLSPQKPTGEKR